MENKEGEMKIDFTKLKRRAVMWMENHPAIESIHLAYASDYMDADDYYKAILIAIVPTHDDDYRSWEDSFTGFHLREAAAKCGLVDVMWLTCSDMEEAKDWVAELSKPQYHHHPLDSKCEDESMEGDEVEPKSWITFDKGSHLTSDRDADIIWVNLTADSEDRAIKIEDKELHQEYNRNEQNSTAKPATLPDQCPANFLCKENEYTWHIGFEAKSTRIKHFDGLLYIGYLIAKPGVPISCRDLYQAGSGKTPDGVTTKEVAIQQGLCLERTKQPTSDNKAKKDYWKLWKQLQDEIDNAEDNPEGELIKEENRKRQAEIEPYLKERVFIDPNDKKAQINIQRRLRTVYEAIDKAGMKNMAKHLQSKIKPDGALGLVYMGGVTWVITLT
jgi:hypothetical protein